MGPCPGAPQADPSRAPDAQPNRPRGALPGRAPGLVTRSVWSSRRSIPSARQSLPGPLHRVGERPRHGPPGRRPAPPAHVHRRPRTGSSARSSTAAGSSTLAAHHVHAVVHAVREVHVRGPGPRVHRLVASRPPPAPSACARTVLGPPDTPRSRRSCPRGASIPSLQHPCPVQQPINRGASVAASVSKEPPSRRCLATLECRFRHRRAAPAGAGSRRSRSRS
jgi:hypothetical protein